MKPICFRIGSKKFPFCERFELMDNTALCCRTLNIDRAILSKIVFDSGVILIECFVAFFPEAFDLRNPSALSNEMHLCTANIMKCR